MEYLVVFAVVFIAIGLRGFQQKVVTANRYKLMSIVGGSIYLMEGSAILMIVKGGYIHLIVGALGAGTGMVFFVYLYNRFFHKPI